MSFDLGVWYSPHPVDAATAGAVYQALAEGGRASEGAPVASPNVAAFLSALRARYAELDDVPEADVDTSPWAGGFETSDRHVLLNLRWSAADAVVIEVAELAATHGLVLYDPQGEEVHLPPGLSAPRRAWQFWRR